MIKGNAAVVAIGLSLISSTIQAQTQGLLTRDGVSSIQVFGAYDWQKSQREIKCGLGLSQGGRFDATGWVAQRKHDQFGLSSSILGGAATVHVIRYDARNPRKTPDVALTAQFSATTNTSDWLFGGSLGIPIHVVSRFEVAPWLLFGYSLSNRKTTTGSRSSSTRSDAYVFGTAVPILIRGERGAIIVTPALTLHPERLQYEIVVGYLLDLGRRRPSE